MCRHLRTPEPEHKTIRGLDGANYWLSGPNAGKRVLPGVEASPEGPRYLRDPINMINQGTGEVKTAQTQAEVSQWSAQGYEVAGESTIPLTRKVKGDIQKKLLNSQEQSSRLERIHSSLKPKFLEAPFQAKMYLYAKQERLGLGLGDEAKRELQEYTTFKVKTAQSLKPLHQ